MSFLSDSIFPILNPQTAEPPRRFLPPDSIHMGIFRGIYRKEGMQFCCLEEGKSGRIGKFRRFPIRPKFSGPG